MRWPWLFCLALGTAAQRPQKMEAPKWLDDDGKELFNDVESDETLGVTPKDFTSFEIF